MKEETVAKRKTIRGYLPRRHLSENVMGEVYSSASKSLRWDSDCRLSTFPGSPGYDVHVRIQDMNRICLH